MQEFQLGLEESDFEDQKIYYRFFEPGVTVKTT